MTEHIKRFGQYVLDMNTLPEPDVPKIISIVFFFGDVTTFYTYPEPTPAMFSLALSGNNSRLGQDKNWPLKNTFIK